MSSAKKGKQIVQANVVDATEPQFDFEASGFFALRAPLLPFDEFLQWGSDLAAASDDGELAIKLSEDRVRLRERLRQIVSRDEIREAIFVASPDLHEYIDQWLAEPNGKRAARVEGSLVRYFTRMSGRATPFGLFASTTLGRVGSKTRLTVAERGKCERHTRLDMDYLFALLDALNRDPQLRRAVNLRPNNSHYRIAGRIRYVESRVRDNFRSYHLVAIDETAFLLATLERAKQGATLAQLATALVDEDVSLEDAESYIEELIECQLLLPDLSLPVTGREPIHSIIEKLRAAALDGETVEVLDQTRQALAMLDAAKLGSSPEHYQKIAERLKMLPGKVELQRLFQVDMIRPVQNPEAVVLSEDVIQQMSIGVRLLQEVYGSPFETNLTRFRDAFLVRYEDKEVPLVEVLDEDLGLGYPLASAAGTGNTPLLQGIDLGGKPKRDYSWHPNDGLLLRKLTDALASGATEIRLEESDLEQMREKNPLPMSSAFCVMGTLAAENEEALARGDYQIYLEGTSGPSGARLLGRFCHADDALRVEVEKHLRAEEALQPDTVFAELVHLPEGRTGNILSRPVLRDYEIAYLGHSGADPERQIPITDLLVSVRDQRVVLRSVKLGREVVPRLTSAHNWVREGAGIYKFLSALQLQRETADLAWDWGGLTSAQFLPRVVYGKLVLAHARWRIGQEELEALRNAQGDEIFRLMQQFRIRRRLPRFITLSEGDNILPIDLDNVLSVESFAHMVKARQVVFINELWPSPEHLCARGTEGRFIHEVIVPFVKKPVKQPAQLPTGQVQEKALAAKAGIVQTTSSARRFSPGSEWLYAKIYCGPATADQVIREVIAPAANKFIAEGLADQWFFIRYSDPDWHLRVRFHGLPETLLEKLWPALQTALAPLIEDGRVWRVQLDTYDRELERYGGAAGIALSEQVFFADSDAVAEIAELLDANDTAMDERWRLTLCGMDRLLNDFGFDLAQKLELAKWVRSGFLAEFNADEAVIDQLGERYRLERKNLESLLDLARDVESSLMEGLAILQRRSVRLRPIADELRVAQRDGRLTKSFAEIVASYLHMHANRLLRSSHRAQELVIYDLLMRLYSSQLARQRQPNQQKVVQAT